MATRGPRYPMEEFARRGDEVYDREIRDKLEEVNKGKVVAIDIETGVYEIADDALEAADRLLQQNSDAQIWMRRVGFPYLHKMVSPRHLRRL